MRRHYSKLDWWILPSLLLLGLFFLSYLFFGFLTQHPIRPWWGPVIYTLAMLVIVSLSWPLHYDVSSNLLTVRAGIISWRIPIDTIRFAQPTTSVIKGPAFSFDRIEVSYVKGTLNRSLYISPKDKEAFLMDLVDHSDCLQKNGDKVVNPNRALTATN